MKRLFLLVALLFAGAAWASEQTDPVHLLVHVDASITNDYPAVNFDNRMRNFSYRVVQPPVTNAGMSANMLNVWEREGVRRVADTNKIVWELDIPFNRLAQETRLGYHSDSYMTNIIATLQENPKCRIARVRGSQRKAYQARIGVTNIAHTAKDDGLNPRAGRSGKKPLEFVTVVVDQTLAGWEDRCVEWSFQRYHYGATNATTLALAMGKWNTTSFCRASDTNKILALWSEPWLEYDPMTDPDQVAEDWVTNKVQEVFGTTPKAVGYQCPKPERWNWLYSVGATNTPQPGL